MTWEEGHLTGSPLEIADSRRNQLQDLANDADSDVSEPAWSDLFKEFGVRKRAEDSHEEDLHSE